jgi:His-Xaa-Ser system protein HxsD
MKGLEGVTLTARKDAASFDVDTRLYPLDAVLGTAYVFIGRAFVRLDQPAPHRVRVSLAGKQPLGPDDVRTLCGEFLNELLGQVLRQRMAKTHGTLRDALLAKALFSAAPTLATEESRAPGGAAAGFGSAPATAPRGSGAAPAVLGDPSLSDLPDDDADYLEDPLGIAIPWEEKYGKAKKEGRRRGGAKDGGDA